MTTLQRAACLLALALLVAAPAGLARAQDVVITHDFQITLVRASEGAHAMPETADEDTVRALMDLVELLPYKNFEIIDTSRVRTQEGARVRLGEAGAFEVFLSVRGEQAGGQILVNHFELDQRAIYHDGEWVYTDPENLLATSFGIRRGETVVVGTSRVMYADQAIVVILEALD